MTGPFKKFAVAKSVNVEGDSKTYTFINANSIDGALHNLSVTIGTDGNPDSLSTDGDVFLCKYKATINSAVLDSLVSQ